MMTVGVRKGLSNFLFDPEGLGKNWRALPRGVRKGLAFELFKLFEIGGLGKNWRALPRGVRKGLAFKLFKLF